MKNIQFVDRVKFPNSTGIVVNMLPFIMGDKNSIPSEYHGYLNLLEACRVEEKELGKVGFLTITESTVQTSTSQRRGGIHTEKHPNLNWGGGGAWGAGKAGVFSRKQGIYLASNVDNSCRAWDFNVKTPGAMGDCDNLKNEIKINKEIYFKNGELYWITDSTPHESLPVKAGTHRQFFRLVTSPVDQWYAQHSTANRLGVTPNCNIIREDKFQKAA